MFKKMIPLFLLSNLAFSFLIANVELIHEKILSGKTILKSEFLSKEIIEKNKRISLKMKNGTRLEFISNFDEQLVSSNGVIYHESAPKNVKKFFINSSIGGSGSYHFSEGDTKISLKINYLKK